MKSAGQCLGAMFILVALAGCNHADTRESDEQTIRALDSQWSKTAGVHDLDGTISYYADDAVLLPPDEPLAASKAAIRSSWAGAMAAFDTLSWEVKTIEVAKSGDLAYLTGAWKGTFKAPNGGSAAGKLLEVWKKQADGKWKCIADTYNSDAPPPGSPTAQK